MVKKVPIHYVCSVDYNVPCFVKSEFIIQGKGSSMHGFYAVSDSHRFDGMAKKLPILYDCSVDYNVPHSELKFSQNS